MNNYRILFTESPISFDNLKPFQETKHQIFFPKEEIEGVHEFDRAALIQTIKDLRPDVLVVGLRFQIDQEIIDLGIKLVATRTSGLDHITGDVEVIKLLGEELTDVVAVPELCLWAMLELVRKRGGQELNGKTLGIIGYGRIGQILDRYAQSLGMTTLPFDIFSSVHQAFTADIVSLNISSTEENRGFMDMEKFKMMKDGSWFLNSARPWLVEEEAFKWALENKLAGAWVDFDLGWTAKNLIQTPHIGGKTLESSLKTEKILIHKLLQWLSK